MADATPLALIDDVVMQEIAAELARNIYPLDDILRRFNIKPDIFEKMRTSHRFQTMHAEALIVWNSSLNARERTRLKSEVMVENMLEPGWRAFNQANQPLAAKVQFMQTVAKLAGMLEGPKNEPAPIAPGDKVNITINLSAPPARYAAVGGAGVITIEKQSIALPPSDPVDDPSIGSSLPGVTP